MSRPADSTPLIPDLNALARVVARELGRRTDASLRHDAHFIEHLSRVARDADRTTRRMDDAQAAASGRALLARALARAHRISLETSAHGGTPGDAPVRGTAVQVMRAAASRQAAPLIDLGVAAGVGRDLWDEVVEQWVDVPADMPEGRYVALRIVGDSMTPLMHTGDTVLVRVGPDVRTNSIIVARHPDDGYLCKRVRAIHDATIDLESLDAGRPTITIPREASCVVGTVLMVWCSHGVSGRGVSLDESMK